VSFEEENYKWAIALRALFVSEGKFSVTLVEALQLGKTLRENADYYGEFSKDAASQMIENAKEFLDTARKLVK
jgi:uncharacterized protein (UPF0332 family)